MKACEIGIIIGVAVLGLSMAPVLFGVPAVRPLAVIGASIMIGSMMTDMLSPSQ